MRSYLYFIPIFLLCLLWSSCRTDFTFEATTGNLEFSRDTIFLDTVFSNLGTSTRALKVFNRSNTDLTIPNIRLGLREDSNYRLNVDGQAGTEFTNVPLLARDSLFIFVEASFDSSIIGTNQFLATDVIEFNSDDTQQTVALISLVQDAVFLFPRLLPDGTRETVTLGSNNERAILQAEGFFLTKDQLNFTNEKPYVIFGYAAINQGDTLTIAPGARVHFHQDSGLFIDQGASLKIRGDLSTDPKLLENEVIFEGDRLEPSFSETPGQWGTIWLSKGSVDHNINYLTIKNATIGLLVEGNTNEDDLDLQITNTQIYNSATINLWGITAAINAENVVLGGAGTMSLYCNLGGNYVFTHSTIANYFSGGFRPAPALQLDNSNGSVSEDLIQASFRNCIIDGTNSLELLLRPDGTSLFNYNFDHCSIKFRDSREEFVNDPRYDFTNESIFNTILLNINTDFLAPRDNDFRLGINSEVIGNGSETFSNIVPIDILGLDRSQNSALGAYQN